MNMKVTNPNSRAKWRVKQYVSEDMTASRISCRPGGSLGVEGVPSDLYLHMQSTGQCAYNGSISWLF